MILALESSCDETAIALINPRAPRAERIHVNLVYSQIREHKAFGGVVPEVAARAHVELIGGLLDQAMAQAQLSWHDLNAIAVTAGPGLIGALAVGVMAAQGLAIGANKPLFGIHHLEGHALTARLTDDIEFPYLALLLSGGHSMFLAVEGLGRYRLLGTTIDDALGEAFDKVAKWLNLDYPGGPALEKLAEKGNGTTFPLPAPLKGRPGADLSFSGLKTAVRLTGEAHQPLNEADRCNLAASFQYTVVDLLHERCQQAFRLWEQTYGDKPQAFVMAGGVAANKAIRHKIEALAHDWQVPVILPPLSLCGDNAAMIGWAAAERWLAGERGDKGVAPKARWDITSLT